MILAISGTPGAGKSAVATVLSKKTRANLVIISSLADNVKHGWDKSRKTMVVNIKDLQKAVNKKISKERINIVDGHLSHLLDADIVIVLRCNPKVLKKRLKKKNWHKSKIAENVEAEILDEISIEAIEKHGKKRIFEIDTSKRTPEGTARIINQILNNCDTKEYRAGKIDWTEKYRDYLIR